MELLTTTFGLVGAVIIIGALLSGVIERSRFPQVAVFILLGTLLGPFGLDLVDVDLQSPIVRVVAVLSLVLVLFTDAVSLNIQEVKSHLKIAAVVLGPGTLLTAILVGFTAWKFLGLPLPAAFILGAALSSTDPVMLRGVLRGGNLPRDVKQALRLESGLNDVVLLPIILVCMALLSQNGTDGEGFAKLGVELFLLGPGAGIIVGLFCIGVLDLIRKKVGVRRDYESLYSLGVAFLAYAAAAAAHGSGFLAAFAAGFVVALMDVELCDCFLEYGETTAEMALLFTFVLFGTSLIWQGFAVLNAQTAIFAVAVILIRPLVFLSTLWGIGLDRRSRMLIAWFGPRGLSSLLMVLLPVFAGISGSQTLFAICCLVVLVSIVVHGSSLMFLPKAEGATTRTKPMETSDDHPVTVDEMLALEKKREEVIVLDVRSESSFGTSDLLAQDAIRVPPDQAVRVVDEKGLSKDAWLIAFCA